MSESCCFCYVSLIKHITSVYKPCFDLEDELTSPHLCSGLRHRFWVGGGVGDGMDVPTDTIV